MYFSVLIIQKDVSFHKRSLAVFKAFSWCLYLKRNLSEGEVAALDLYTQIWGPLVELRMTVLQAEGASQIRSFHIYLIGWAVL